MSPASNLLQLDRLHEQLNVPVNTHDVSEAEYPVEFEYLKVYPLPSCVIPLQSVQLA